jgi:hypothetical protein
MLNVSAPPSHLLSALFAGMWPSQSYKFLGTPRFVTSIRVMFVRAATRRAGAAVRQRQARRILRQEARCSQRARHRTTRRGR